MKAALAELGGWAPGAAIVLLLANDHILKKAFHNAVTGKLSDLAICFVMPLLVSAALGMVTEWTRARRLRIGALVTVVVFTSLEMSDVAGALFKSLLASVGMPGAVLTRDPTDLVALACVPLGVAYGDWQPGPAARGRLAKLGGALVMIAGALALMATSPADRCPEWTAPVVFHTEGDCGPPGVVVVEADAYQGRISIANPEALGLPTGGSGGGASFTGEYLGANCPYTLAAGEWEVTVGTCSGIPPTSQNPDVGVGPPEVDLDAGIDARDDADAGAEVDAGAGPDAGDGGTGTAVCPSDYRECRAALEGGVLWFTCHRGDPAVPICRSRLTEMP